MISHSIRMSYDARTTTTTTLTSRPALKLSPRTIMKNNATRPELISDPTSQAKSKGICHKN